MASPGHEPLLSVYENDPDVGEIVALFVSEMPRRRADIVRAAEAGDAAEAARFAHQLKGAAGGYGFETLGQIAAAAEHALNDLQPSKSDDASAVYAAAAPLIDACDRVRLANPGAAA
ncbi:MAG: Hpt domain-containing protein [Phycisphaerales bacterium]|jgi:HPt (histidine-containing phosphotransfer) domain-containing protein